MKKRHHIIKIIVRVFFILLMIAWLLPLISLIMPAGLNPIKTKAFFNDKHIKFQDTILRSGKRQIRFVTSGNDTMPMVLFIHGSPGSWDAFKDYLADTGLQKKAYLVAVDRPGYGGSGHSGESEIKQQGLCIAGALKLRKNNKKVTLVGHSYGGPVAVKFAIDYPVEIKQLILIAPTICPEIEEHIQWKRNLQKMSNWFIWRWSLSNDLKNSANEMRPLPSELRAMEKYYPILHLPILEIHGTADALAPIGNQLYVKKYFVNSEVDTITLSGKNHFIPWTLTEKMIAIIKQRL